MANVRLNVFRGDATGGEIKAYDVETDPGMVVLDVIHRLQATQTPDLAVRWNCKAGKCGSCSAEINGKPRLMCMTRMSLFGEDDVELVRREQVPMRPDLLDLFELDELKKYFTGDELGGHRAKESM